VLCDTPEFLGLIAPRPLLLELGTQDGTSPGLYAAECHRRIRRAYALARAGEPVELPEREVEVHRFEQCWQEGERRGFVIECSSGTYVRSLIAALGDAYCEELRRTRIGDFDVADADPEVVVPLGDTLARFMPRVALGPDDARRAAHGVAVPGEAPGLDHVRLTDAEGLIAIAEPRDGGLLKPVVGFRGV